jgi:hypothetical protein
VLVVWGGGGLGWVFGSVVCVCVWMGCGGITGMVGFLTVPRHDPPSIIDHTIGPSPGLEHQQVAERAGQRHQRAGVGQDALRPLPRQPPHLPPPVRAVPRLPFPFTSTSTYISRMWARPLPIHPSPPPTYTPLPSHHITSHLRDSLGGNAKTFLVACTSPNDENFAETLSTLKFAQRAKMIKNKVGGCPGPCPYRLMP